MTQTGRAADLFSQRHSLRQLLDNFEVLIFNSLKQLLLVEGARQAADVVDTYLDDGQVLMAVGRQIAATDRGFGQLQTALVDMRAAVTRDSVTEFDQTYDQLLGVARDNIQNIARYTAAKIPIDVGNPLADEVELWIIAWIQQKQATWQQNVPWGASLFDYVIQQAQMQSRIQALPDNRTMSQRQVAADASAMLDNRTQSQFVTQPDAGGDTFSSRLIVNDWQTAGGGAAAMPMHPDPVNPRMLQAVMGVQPRLADDRMDFDLPPNIDTDNDTEDIDTDDELQMNMNEDPDYIMQDAQIDSLPGQVTFRPRLRDP